MPNSVDYQQQINNVQQEIGQLQQQLQSKQQQLTDLQSKYTAALQQEQKNMQNGQAGGSSQHPII